MRKTILIVSTLVALGCQDPDFNKPELLKAPRILAVQAEPPQPSYGATTTLRALIYQPPARTDEAECAGADTGPKYQWSWCPLATSSANGYECPMKQGDLDQLTATLGLGPAPQLDLGTGETATLRNPFPASLLYSLCRGDFVLPSTSFPVGKSGVDAGTTSVFSCQFSVGDDQKPDLKDKRPLAFPVTVMLKYTPPCGSTSQDNFGPELTTVFTVRLSTDETVPPDQNPTIGDIFAIPEFDAGSVVPGRDSAAPTELDGGTSDDGGNAGGIDGGEAIDGGTSDDGGNAGGVDSAQPVVAAEPVTPPAGSVRMDTIVFPRQQRVGLWLDIPLSASEPLPRPSTRDQPSEGNVLYFERLSTAWFAEAGEFGGSHGNNGRRGGYLPPYNQTSTNEDEERLFDERTRRSFWALPTTSDYSSDTARVVVVVRDSRGGVAWASGVATLETRP